MKLLLDENLSRRREPALQARFPGSSQVALLGLERATDAQICDHAAQHGFVICSKDEDFQRLVAARGWRWAMSATTPCWLRCWAPPTAWRPPSKTPRWAWR